MTNQEKQPFDITEGKPNFAVRAMVIKDGQVLLGKNKGTYGNGMYAFPGGHLHYLESFQDCIKRELQEECGIEVDNIRYPSVSNMVEDGGIHNIHITLLADYKSGEPTALEPDKYESWAWYDIDNLPSPLFKNCQLSIQNYKDGTNYFDIEDTNDSQS